jgi:hypothetical protein
MRGRILSMLAGVAASLGAIGAGKLRGDPVPTFQPPRPRRRVGGDTVAAIHAQPVPVYKHKPKAKVRRGGFSLAHHMNGGRECARRVRQMARGDVLNWYPGQVRANWHG